MTMATVQRAPDKKSTQYIWHPRVHEEWAKEQLYFWRLHFSSVYESETIARILRKLFKTQKVLSYAIYEAVGMWDFFVRAWLPTSVNVDKFEHELLDQLKPLHLNAVDKFRVTETLLHWAWTDNNNSFQTPNADVVRRLNDVDILKINTSDFSDAEKEKFKVDCLIAPCEPTGGIKFIAMLTEPGPHLTAREAADVIGRQLLEILRDSSRIHHQSLYRGEGSAQFLVAGRVAYTDFDRIYDDLVKKVYGLQLGKTFPTRMYTHIIVRSAMEAGFFEDRLATSKQVEEPGSRAIEHFLAQPEGEQLEFKGSAFLDVKQWIHTGNRVLEKKTALQGVLRAITGMLNTNGGVIIIGVLEKDKFSDKKSKDALGSFPECGENILFGLTLDYGEKNWDAYQLRLLDLIKDHIDPSARPWVSLKRAEYSGREFAMILVRQPSDTWFYLMNNSQFLIRNGASTSPLSGRDADAYKRANPR